MFDAKKKKSFVKHQKPCCGSVILIRLTSFLCI